MKDVLLYYKIFSAVLAIVTIETLGLIDGIEFGYSTDLFLRALVRAVCYTAIIHFVMSGQAYKISYTKI